MKTIKSHTDLEQSRILSEFLPHKTADQTWEHIAIAGANLDVSEELQYRHNGDMPFILYSGIGIPCWSLAALLDVIPQEIFNGEYVINITEGCDNKWVLTYDLVESRYNSYYELSTGADNLVDACYEMIVNLHEQKLL